MEKVVDEDRKHPLLLNQNLLTCVMIYAELIGFDIFETSLEVMVNKLVTETIENFSFAGIFVEDGVFVDKDIKYSFTELYKEYKEEILDKSKNEENITEMFGKLLNIYSKHFDVEVSLEAELAMRKELDDEEVEIWTFIDEHVYNCTLAFIDLFDNTEKEEYPLEDFINDILLMRISKFIDLYENKENNEEDYEEYLKGTKDFITTDLNEIYFAEMFLNLIELEKVLYNK